MGSGSEKVVKGEAHKFDPRIAFGFILFAIMLGYN